MFLQCHNEGNLEQASGLKEMINKDLTYIVILSLFLYCNEVYVFSKLLLLLLLA